MTFSVNSLMAAMKNILRSRFAKCEHLEECVDQMSTTDALSQWKRMRLPAKDFAHMKHAM